ncbi:MAG: V4R domain-containing protein [Candidatus Micrarchaeaceae archaeon]
MRKGTAQRNRFSNPKNRKQAKEKTAQKPRSTELFLIGKIVNSSGAVQAHMALRLQDLIYNIAEETKKYAYKSGLALGELAASHFSGLSSLERILASAGLGHVLYAPFETEAKITSARAHGISINANTNVHSFESGIIAGFLSRQTAKRLHVRETHCVFNGSEFCQFEINSSLNPFAGLSYIDNIDSASRLLAAAASAASSAPAAAHDIKAASEDYFSLSFMPLEREPLLSAAEKLAYAIGVRASKYMRSENSGLSMLANYINLGFDTVNIKGKSKTFVLRYPHSLSSSGFLRVSSALVKGYLCSSHGSSCSVERRLSAGAYHVLFKF